MEKIILDFSVFVFNLEPETEEAALWRIFRPFGAVRSVKVIKFFITNKYYYSLLLMKILFVKF